MFLKLLIMCLLEVDFKTVIKSFEKILRLSFTLLSSACPVLRRYIQEGLEWMVMESTARRRVHVAAVRTS
jgi:hypothetical protein